LRKLKAAFDLAPTSLYIKSFVDMKAEEFLSILKDATKPEQKQEAYTLLSQIDPGGIEKYEVLIR
jgi:hypothetical protein